MPRLSTCTIVVLLTVALVSTTACIDVENGNSYLAAKQALSGVHEGMTLSALEEAMKDAWHYGVCYQDETGSEHIFLFGSRKLDKTAIVPIRLRREGDQQLVSGIYGPVDDSLRNSYTYCIERSLASQGTSR